MGNTVTKAKNIQQTHSSYQSRFILESLEGIIFKLSEDNIHDSAEMTLYLVYENFLDFPYYFICRFIYSSFISKRKDCTFYFMFIEEINTKEKDINPSINGLINEFVNFILSLNSNESFYLLEKMIEMNLISSSLVKDKNTFYFAHYIDNEDLSFYKNKNENYDELSANDYELHKKYITEGHNPDKIAKILQNDEIEKLQEISSQTNFNFNQYIKPSLYERYSYINHSFVSLIEYAAFFGSANCFKYLLMNDANVMYAGKYAIAGGNLEIIHLCEQNHASFENANETAIEFHRNNIFKYLYKNKIVENYNEYEILCLLLTNEFMNIKLFNILLEQERINVNAKDKRGNTLLFYASEKGNIEIAKLLLEQKWIDINAKNDCGETALIWSSRNGKLVGVKLLLEQKGIDVNAKDNNRNTALIYSSENGHLEIVKLLLEQKGIDVNAKDNCVLLQIRINNMISRTTTQIFIVTFTLLLTFFNFINF